MTVGRPSRIYWHSKTFKTLNFKGRVTTPQVLVCMFLDSLEQWQVELAKISPRSAFVWARKRGKDTYYNAEEEWIIFYPHEMSRAQLYPRHNDTDDGPYRPDLKDPEDVARSMAIANESLEQWKANRKPKEE